MPGFNINGSGGGISSVDSKKDVYRSYRWRLVNISGGINIQAKDLNTALDVTMPQMDFEILLVPGMSMDYKIPKKPIFNNVDVTFYDTSGLQEKFEKWADKIWNPRDGLFEGKAPTNIKAEIKLELLDNNDAATRKITLQGAWPKRISHSKLDMAAGTIKTVIVEFAYDYYCVE